MAGFEELLNRPVERPSLRGEDIFQGALNGKYKYMSPETALKWETYPYRPQYGGLMEQGMYPVSPEFVSPGWQGSGTTPFSPSEYFGKMFLNIERPEEWPVTIPHERRHLETGMMGGISPRQGAIEGIFPQGFMRSPEEQFLRQIDEERWRWPQETYAYMPELFGEVSPERYDYRYSFPGEFRKHLYWRGGEELEGR